MRHINSLDAIIKEEDLLVGIDITGTIRRIFTNPIQVPGCLFLLCTKGTCSIKIHLGSYELKRGCIAVIFPNQFFQIEQQSNDCRFAFIGFSQKQMQEPVLFSNIIEYIPSIFEKPVITLNEKVTRIFYDYFLVLIRAHKDIPGAFPPEHQSLICTQLIMRLGNIYRQEVQSKKNTYSRNQEIVKNLMRFIVENYKSERNISFYAEKMHLSPQHLSTTIKKTTGKTLTDIISGFVIKDAQGKLKSTELTIQEIAYSLNFPDISFFGKYFKRYTGMSPKQYRNME